MTPAAAVALFTVELGRALHGLGYAEPVPQVLVIELADAPRDVTARTRAFTYRSTRGERRVVLMALTAWTASQRRHPEAWLRCMARHEAVHVKADHRPHTAVEAEVDEAEVALVLRRRWNELDPTCDARLGQ